MDYHSHLSKDKKLKRIIEEQELVKLTRRKKIHIYLCGSIMSQQLSTKVAAIIHKRFLDLYGGEPTAEQILDTPYETLRGIGLSGAKANYVQNVARFAIENGMSYEMLGLMTNEDAIKYLTQIKGVGRWTVEMLLMFALGREDVFALDDLGIQQAMEKIYKLDKSDKKAFREEMIRISEKWSPYRSFACLHLWQWKDNGRKKEAVPKKKKATRKKSVRT